MIATVQEAGLWNVSAEEYHADYSAVSHSMLKVFAESVPLYHGRFITRTIPAPAPTDAMALGSLVHLLALEPDLADSRIAIPPAISRRSNAGKEEHSAFAKANAGKLIVSQEDCDLAKKIVAGIRKNETANLILERHGYCEQSIRWEDRTGLPMKARLDKILMPPAKIVADIKTAIDITPTGFGKAMANFGYHRQAALYQDAAHAVFGESFSFVFIVVSKEDPFECACYIVDDASLEQGRKENRQLIEELNQRAASGDWSSRYAVGIQTAGLPRWAFN
jgi:exodeoxyribonuclease VIII